MRSACLLFISLCLFALVTSDDVVQETTEDLIEIPESEGFVDIAIDPNEYKAIYAPRPVYRSYYVYNGPQERSPKVSVSFFGNGPSRDTSHRPTVSPPCFIKLESGEHRRCTKEELLLRRDIEELLLDTEYHYTAAKIFNISSVDLIWVRVTLPKSKENEFPIDSFPLLKSGQKINRFPLSSQEINKKDNFGQNYKAMQDKFGVEEFNFHPETYVIPEMLPQLKEQAQLSPLEKWIAKPVLGGQGLGIVLINSTDILTENFVTNGEYLVQRYLGNPLLINGYKHTLRIYPLITSVNPLRVYLNKYGIAKFATKLFTSELDSFNTDNRNMHITNQALNSYQKAYYANSTDSASGFRWNMNSWRQYMREEKNLDDNAIWASITDVVVKAMISAESKIRHKVVEQQLPTDCCFQILGTDVDMDANMHPWLIESNVNPTLSSKLQFERVEKIDMLEDMFALVKVTNKSEQLAQELDDISVNIKKFINNCEASPQKEAVEKLLRPDTFYVLVDHEYETSVSDSFSLAFPNPATYKKYTRFIENPGNANLLLWNWLELKETCKINV